MGQLLPPGVSQEQHDRAVAAGVDPAADPICFTAAFITVPDDPRFSISATTATLPQLPRCDAADGTTITITETGHETEYNGHGPFGLRGNASWHRLPAGKSLSTGPLDMCNAAPNTSAG